MRAYNKQQEITNLNFTVKQTFLFYFTSLQLKRLQEYKRKLQQNDFIRRDRGSKNVILRLLNIKGHRTTITSFKKT